MHILRINSMFGTVELVEENNALVRVSLRSGESPELDAIPCRKAPSPLLEEAEQQLNEYFCHLRTEFDLPLAPQGTPFQKEVWAQLEQIPYGETRTYGQIAAALGKPHAAQAVGAACRCNPLWLILPCHRVVGAKGALTGYVYGTDLKQALLEWEQE